MPRKSTPFKDAGVSKAFEAYPPSVRSKLKALRQLIFDTAAATEGVGKIEEALKWGEPAYLTAESKSGSTIRIGWRKLNPSQYAMYFHCQTTLVHSFRKLFPDDFKYEGNRAIVFEGKSAPPLRKLSTCIAAALTYHRRKR